MSVVLDSSAVLAAIFGEEGGGQVIAHLDRRSAWISAVNLAEILGKLVDVGYSEADARATAGDLAALVRTFDAETAAIAGLLRGKTRRAGLSLGDRACLALGLAEGLPVVTADRAWAELELGIPVEVIR